MQISRSLRLSKLARVSAAQNPFSVVFCISSQRGAHFFEQIFFQKSPRPYSPSFLLPFLSLVRPRPPYPLPARSRRIPSDPLPAEFLSRTLYPPYPFVSLSPSCRIPCIPPPSYSLPHVSPSSRIPFQPYPLPAVSPSRRIPFSPYPFVSVSPSLRIPFLPYPLAAVSPSRLPFLPYPLTAVSPSRRSLRIPYPLPSLSPSSRIPYPRSLPCLPAGPLYLFLPTPRTIKRKAPLSLSNSFTNSSIWASKPQKTKIHEI